MTTPPLIARCPKCLGLAACRPVGGQTLVRCAICGHGIARPSTADAVADWNAEAEADAIKAEQLGETPR